MPPRRRRRRLDAESGHTCPACPVTPGLTGGYCSSDLRGPGGGGFPNLFGAVEAGSMTDIQPSLEHMCRHHDCVSAQGT